MRALRAYSATVPGRDFSAGFLRFAPIRRLGSRVCYARLLRGPHGYTVAADDRWTSGLARLNVVSPSPRRVAPRVDGATDFWLACHRSGLRPWKVRYRDPGRESSHGTHNVGTAAHVGY